MKKLFRGHYQMGKFTFQRQGKYFDGKLWDLYRMVDGKPEYLGTFRKRHLAESVARMILAAEIMGKDVM